MSRAWGPSGIGFTTPDVIAKGSLDTLGVEDHWSPYWIHASQMYITLTPL